MRGKKEKLNLEEPYFQSQTNVEEPIQRTKQGQSEAQRRVFLKRSNAQPWAPARGVAKMSGIAGGGKEV